VADSFLILAQAAGGPQSAVVQIGFFVLLFVIMYLFVIRPQTKQMKAQRDLHASLKKGDEVVTAGGVLGRIYLVSERTVTLEVSSGVRIRVLKTSISAKGTVADDATTAKADEKKEEK
jgi:preprotein translocase subunit YajC